MEQDLGHFFYSSTDCMYVAGFDGFWKRVNPALQLLLGYQLMELQGVPYLEFVHPGDHAKTNSEFAKLSAGHGSTSFESRYLCKNGEQKWLSWRCVNVGGLIFATGRDITQRKKSEAELLGPEGRLQMLLENSPVVLFSTNQSGEFTLSVGKVLEKLGLKQNQIVGENIYDLCKGHSDITEPVRRACEGQPSSSTINYKSLIFDATYAPLVAPGGEIKGAIAVAVEVTELKMAELREQALRAEFARQSSEERFRETFDFAGIGLAHLSLDGKIQLLNREFAHLLGYAPDDLLQKNYLELLAPADKETPKVDREALLTGQIAKLVRERLFRKRDGSLIWMLATSTSVADQSGKGRYFIVAHKDISKRKKMEDSLRSNEEKLRILAETIPQIVWTAAETGEIEYFNQRWFQYTGSNADLETSSAWQNFVHPDDAESCISEWKKAVRTGEPYVNERRFKRADGEYRWHLGRALPVRDGDGRILKWFGTCTDIHDHKIAEKEKASSLIRERVAEENARIKTEFLATISHEIRTPLNSIIGMSELMLDSQLNSDQYEYADTIRNSAEVLLDLINDVLDLSKIEAGRLSIERIDFDLHKIVRDVQQELAWAATQKGVQLEVNIEQDVPSLVSGDMIRTRQILSNLAANAVKFTHEGAVSIRVSRKHDDLTQVRIRFEIEDTGIGISELEVAKLFEPFTQVDSSMSRKYGGTGLGLSICKKLTSLMNGEIGMRSQLGIGSSFYFELPFLRPTDYGRGSLSPLPEENNWQSVPRILVAEDQIANYKVMSLFLQKLGCKATVVENGVAVLDALERDDFDLILMDCQMPELDGYQTARSIRSRKNKSYRNIPIIATTANAVAGDRERCLEAGMTSYLSKPIRFSELRGAIAGCLRDFVKTDSDIEPNKPSETSRNRFIESQSIDWSVLTEIEQLDASEDTIFSEVISAFRGHADSRRDALLEAIKKDDYEEVKKLAHALKSSSSYVGAIKLQGICEEIRHLANTRDNQALSVRFGELKSELETVLLLLQTGPFNCA